jgi:hypothetical protein
MRSLVLAILVLVWIAPSAMAAPASSMVTNPD